MTRMCRNNGIRQAQKTLGNDAGHFEAIEVLLAHFA
jgi:hypothetical protein